MTDGRVLRRESVKQKTLVKIVALIWAYLKLQTYLNSTFWFQLFDGFGGHIYKHISDLLSLTLTFDNLVDVFF